MLLCLIISTQAYKIKLICGFVVITFLRFSLVVSGVRCLNWKKRKYAPAK